MKRERRTDTVTIRPADCGPDEAYVGTVHGKRRIMVRCAQKDALGESVWLVARPDWQSHEYVTDHVVSGLVRLVPAREVTRDDLPDDPDGRWETFRDRFKAFDGYRSESHQHSLWTVFRSGIQYGETRFLDHLNASGGLPADDRWRRAHAIVEQERDQARESLRRLRDEKDFDLFTVRDQLKQCRGERKEMTRDRDEWRARAEAAEARTTPARTVSRANIEKAIQGAAWLGDHEAPIVDAVSALLHPEQTADPVEDLAHEFADVLGWDDWDAIQPEDVELLRQIAGHVHDREEDRHVDQ